MDKVVSGSIVKLFLGGTLYPTAQSISYSIDYGEEPRYGVDSAFPQEIIQTRISVKGQVTGIRLKQSGGIQGSQLRALIRESLHAPYISLQLKERSTDDMILFVPQVKITNESFSVSAKGVVSISFGFAGIIPMSSVDIS